MIKRCHHFWQRQPITVWSEKEAFNEREKKFSFRWFFLSLSLSLSFALLKWDFLKKEYFISLLINWNHKPHFNCDCDYKTRIWRNALKKAYFFNLILKVILCLLLFSIFLFFCFRFFDLLSFFLEKTQLKR